MIQFSLECIEKHRISFEYKKMSSQNKHAHLLGTTNKTKEDKLEFFFKDHNSGFYSSLFRGPRVLLPGPKITV